MVGAEGEGSGSIPGSKPGSPALRGSTPGPSWIQGEWGTNRPCDERLASASLRPLHLQAAFLRVACTWDTRPSKTLRDSHHYPSLIPEAAAMCLAGHTS